MVVMQQVEVPSQQLEVCCLRAKLPSSSIQVVVCHAQVM